MGLVFLVLVQSILPASSCLTQIGGGLLSGWSVSDHPQSRDTQKDDFVLWKDFPAFFRSFLICFLKNSILALWHQRQRGLETGLERAFCQFPCLQAELQVVNQQSPNSPDSFQFTREFVKYFEGSAGSLGLCWGPTDVAIEAADFSHDFSRMAVICGQDLQRNHPP